MSNLVGVVDYGVAGNIPSITKALEAAGADVTIVKNVAQLEQVDKIVLPGVGSFSDAMIELQKSGLMTALKEHVTIKPTLGICLGMQILAKVGFEYGESEGLGVFNGEVRPIICHGQVPHMGFNSINVLNGTPLLNGIENEEFYFMHSFEVVNYTDVIALTDYSSHTFVSAINKGTAYGVQFHPEKSREAGIQLFRNFIALELN